MARIGLLVLFVICLLVTVSAWAQTATQQTGLDKLINDTALSCATGEPALWSLFSTQGSALVMRTAEGYAATRRYKLKTDATLAPKFALPAGLKLTQNTFAGSARNVQGVAILTGKAPRAVTTPQVYTPETELRDLANAFGFHAPGTAVPQSKPYIKPPSLPAPQWRIAYSAVQDGSAGAWRFTSACLTPAATTVSDPEVTQSVMAVYSLFETALTRGDLQALTGNLNEDPFTMGATMADGQSWYFTSPRDLVVTLGGLASMAGGLRTSLPNVAVLNDGPIATVTGDWYLDAPMLGSMKLKITSILVKPADKWLVVSLCAGPEK